MIDMVNRGVGTHAPLSSSPFLASDTLRPEQSEAVRFVLSSCDRAVSISGAAGTGKTATLKELHRGLAEAGRKVTAIAPTMSAIEELRKVGFADAMTVSRLVEDSRAQVQLAGAVVIVDEAGMLSARQMHDVLQMAERFKARLVFSGDTKQIQSVEAGDALRILEKESRLKGVSLTQVQRQTKVSYRQAIEEFRRNPERGFAKLEEIGAVREVAAIDRAQTVAEAYLASAGRSALVVCATHDEIDRVTEAIRDERRKTGELTGAVTCERHVSLNWTTAQKSDPRNFQAGQVLGFHRAVRGIGKNEVVEVVRVEARHVIVRGATGESKLTGKQAKSFDVLESRSIDVAAGDRLLITANRREPGLHATNGEIVGVSRVEAGGRILLDDGRTLPPSFKQFTHGYAVTAHRSQVKSVDAVIVSADGMQKELFYVAASRGRQAITVVTSDKERLRETVGRATARQSASELWRHDGRCVPRGVRQGMTAAREVIRRAARFIASLPKHFETKSEPRKEKAHERGFGR